jgi:hypothetical protein
MYRQIIVNLPNSKLRRNRFSVSRVVIRGQTHGKVMQAFLQHRYERDDNTLHNMDLNSICAISIHVELFITKYRFWN